MCVQSSLCQLWRELHRRNEGNLESDYQNIGLKWNPKQDAHLLEAFMHQGIKFNSTQQIRSHWPHNSREPCHQLVSSDGDRQRARAFYQMDQRGHTHPKGRTTVTRAATNWATHTTAFLTRRLPVVSRTGRTEYQLLLMKASDRGRNVEVLDINFGRFDEFN